MSVRKFGKSWYVDVSWRGKRHRLRSPDNTIAGARALEQRVRRELADHGDLGQLDPAATRTELTFGAFVERWMRDYVEVNNKPSEIRTKRITLRASLVPAFGHRTLRSIGPADVEAYKAACLARGVSPKTVNNHLAILRRALVIAAEWSLLEGVPMVRPLPVGERPVFSLPLRDAIRLADSIGGEPWRTMVLVGVFTGLRFSELIALEWPDVVLDGDGPAVSVARGAVLGQVGPTKTYRARRVPLPRAAVDALRRLPRHGARVFAHPAGFVPYGTAIKRLRGAAARCGLPRVGWHTLRHTYLTELGRRGAPLHTVRQLAGHTDIRTTMRYAHVLPEMLVSAVRLLEQPDEPWRSSDVPATGRHVTVNAVGGAELPHAAASLH